jgi:aspartate-semialdehyde dehydrogenase
VPSLMLVQAPVFHGYAFSIYIELDSPMSIGHIESALAGDHVQVLRADETPSNVNVAGATDVQVTVRPDTQHANGFWIWAAADNLRIMATLAVECAEQMVSTRPRGKVQ